MSEVKTRKSPREEWKKTMLLKYGSEEAIQEFMHAIASKGGRALVPKGFARMPFDKVSRAGTLGGQRSRRPKKVVNI